MVMSTLKRGHPTPGWLLNTTLDLTQTSKHELCIAYIQDVGRRHSISQAFLDFGVHLHVLGIV